MVVDMRHLKFLDVVAKADVQCLQEKERTYKGSWKSQGGKNAWAMIRRKIDRLMIMLGEPTPPSHFNLENLNDTIKSVIEGTRLPGTLEATAEILFYMRDTLTAGDIFTKIQEDPSGNDGSVLAEVRDLRRYLLLVEAEIVARANPDPVMRTISALPDADESHHSSTYNFPWRITKEQYDAIHARVPTEATAFWTKRTPNCWVLDPHVESEKMPRELNNLYVRHGTGGWIVDIDKVPANVRDIFPSLQIERNMKEHSELPKWQMKLYIQREEKLVLVNAAWHADNG